MSDSLWHDASDELRHVERIIRETEEPLTPDQRLQIVQIKALLSISQELSSLNPQNTTSYGDGGKRNGWGLPIPD